jgi:glycosyltransferase involved in cell wall biosynthesis
MRVTISTTGRFQPAFVWAAYLERQGQLERIVTPTPYERISEFGVSRQRTTSLVPFAAWTYAVQRVARRAPPSALELNQLVRTVSFDTSVSALLGKCDAFNGWTGASLRSLRVARRRGIPTVLQTGSAHIVKQAELIRHEAAKYGVSTPVTHPGIIARALREYDEADRIVVPSAFVHRTFIEAGVSPDKIVMVPWAAVSVVDAGDRSERQEGPVRVLFVGACSLRKGIQYLLEAARLVGSEAAVRIVGPENHRLLKTLGGVPDNVEVVGVKRGGALRAEFLAADVFVLPSVEDGSALVTLEAMLAGLAPVVSAQAGAALIEEGKSGYVVPACDAHALADRIQLLARDESLRARVGAAARAAAAPRTTDVYGEELTRLVYDPLLSGVSTV